MDQVEDVYKDARHRVSPPRYLCHDGLFQELTRGWIYHQGNKLAIAPPDMGVGVRKQTGRVAQEAFFNPAPLSEIQVVLGFKLHLDMDLAKETSG